MSTLGLAILVDFLRVAGDHRGFAADPYLAFVKILRRASHLNDQIGLLDDFRIPFVGFDAGEMHARFDQDGIIDHDLDGVGARSDDIRAAHGVFGAIDRRDFDAELFGSSRRRRFRDFFSSD